MKKLLITLIVFSSGCLFSQGINFTEGSWQSVKEKAAAENKIIMVDVYADWCVPCKVMAKNVFTNSLVGDFYNANYINYQIDAEKGEGVSFAKEYNVEFYPTILFINAGGELLEKKIGAMNDVDFILAGENALIPENRLFTMEKRYNEGEREPGFLLNYVKALHTAFMPYENILNEYFELQDETSRTTPENTDVILKYVNSYESRIFKYFVANRKKYSEIKDTEKIEKKIFDVYAYGLFVNAMNFSEAEVISYFRDIENEGLELPQSFIYKSYMDYYQVNGNWEKFMKNAEVYTEKYMDYSNKDYAWSMLNVYAWSVYENLSDKKSLQTASKWAKKSIELQENYYNLDTYAAIQFKLGNKTEAGKYAELAVKKGKEEGVDVSATEELLVKIKKMK